MMTVTKIADSYDEGGHVQIDRHMYLTEDGKRVVEEGDPEGRWLWAAKGGSKPRDEAERLGYAPKAELKKAEKPKRRKTTPSDKKREKSEDKGA